MNYVTKVIDFVRDLPDFVKHGFVGFVFGLIFGLIL